MITHIDETTSTLELSEDEFLQSTYATDFDEYYTVDRNLPRAISDPSRTKISQHCIHDLGGFDRLPCELQQQVLTQLDLASFINFSCVNRRARWLGQAAPGYHSIMTDIPRVVSAIQYVGMGEGITCDKLYKKLCQPECDSCGHFGDFLYILTFKRVCFLCFTQLTDFCPIQLLHATRKWHPNSGVLQKLPRVRSIPGLYSLGAKKMYNAAALLDRQHARRTALSHGRSLTVSRCGPPRGLEPIDSHENNPLRFQSSL